MYGPSVQAMDTQLKAQLTLLSSLGAFCLFELRVFQTFLDNLRLICSGHGYPTQRAANTSCPRSDRFWLLELRVSRHFSTFYGPSVQAMDIQLGARHRRWTPTIHRGCARRVFKINLAACQCGAEALQTPGRPGQQGTPSFDRPQRRQVGFRPPWPIARRFARRVGRDLQAGIRPDPRARLPKGRGLSRESAWRLLTWLASHLDRPRSSRSSRLTGVGATSQNRCRAAGAKSGRKETALAPRV